MMPLIGFTVFKDKILSGKKRQTIRVLRKKPVEVGDKLCLYWHLRQKDCEKLKEAHCTEEFQIQFDSGFIFTDKVIKGSLNCALSNKEKDRLAKKDGFKNAEEMLEWFYSKYDDVEDRIFQVIRW